VQCGHQNKNSIGTIWKITVKVRLEYGLEKRLELPAQSFTLEQKKSIKKAAKAQDDWWDNASGAYLKKDIKISFTVPNEDWAMPLRPTC